MYWLIIGLAVGLDQLTKNLVRLSFELGETHCLIPKLLDFIYIHNSGAAWGILEGKQTLLIIFTAAVMLAMVVFSLVYRKKLTRLEFYSLAMIVGGGIGNLIDRVTFNYVTDFIDIHIIPVFNVADIFVTVGCFLLIIAEITHSK